MNDKPQFSDKPSSSIQPDLDREETLLFSDTVDDQVKLWKQYGIDMYYQYKKGVLISNKAAVNPESFELSIHTMLQCMFQAMREHVEQTVSNLEERQNMLIKLTAVERLFDSSVDILKMIDLKLARNLILPIMHGYINECVKHIAEDHERKYKHKHPKH